MLSVSVLSHAAAAEKAVGKGEERHRLTLKKQSFLETFLSPSAVETRPRN